MEDYLRTEFGDRRFVPIEQPRTSEAGEESILELPDDRPSPQEQVEQRQLAEALDDAVRKLSEPERTIFTLHY
jgi:DNA-directed RNA polymerase specialized sigma24 family protein